MPKQDEKLTVRKFMLRKFPTNKYMDCPIPQHHWETIQEYAEEYASQQQGVDWDKLEKEFICFFDEEKQAEFNASEVLFWFKSNISHLPKESISEKVEDKPMNAEQREKLWKFLAENGFVALETDLEEIENIINPKEYPYPA